MLAWTEFGAAFPSTLLIRSISARLSMNNVITTKQISLELDFFVRYESRKTGAGHGVQSGENWGKVLELH